MPEPESQAILGGKLTPRYLATLVAAAAAILVIGSALRPRKSASETAPPPSQTEVRRLQRLAERQSLQALSDHLAAVAADVASRIVLIEPVSSTGIAWSPDLVVAAAQGDPTGEGATLLTASGEQLAASRVVGGPGLPLAAFQVAGRLEPPARRDEHASALSPGAWLLAVWRGNGGHAFAPGHYVETRPVRCGDLGAREVASSLDLTASMAGGGLFDLDGALVAVVLPCEGRYAALEAESVELGLVEGRSSESRLRSLYGLRVRPLDDGLRRHLGVESGVLVSEIWAGHAGDLAGLRPGDVILSLDGDPVTSPQDLQTLLLSRERTEAVLGLSRARQRRKAHVVAGAFGSTPAGEPQEGPGLRLAPADGYRIGRVVPGGHAARAGIREGDRLLRVDFVAPSSSSEASRALSAVDRPVFVEIQSGARRFGALLPRR